MRLFAVIDKSKGVASTEVVVEYTHSKFPERQKTSFRVDLTVATAGNYGIDGFNDVYH